MLEFALKWATRATVSSENLATVTGRETKTILALLVPLQPTLGDSAL